MKPATGCSLQAVAPIRTWIVLGAFALLGAGVAGCGDKGASRAVEPIAAENVAPVAEPEPPALAELRSALGLTPEQAAALEEPLRTWDRAHDELMTRIRDGACDASGPEYGLGGAVEPPHFRFIESAKPLLTREQLRKLVSYLEQRREADRLRLRSGDGAEAGGLVLRRIFYVLVDEFQLTDAQLRSARLAFAESFATFRSLRTDYVSGVLTAEGVRDGVAAALATLEERLETALGAEPYARLRELLGQARATIAQRLLDTLQARTDRHVAFLTLVLELDATQAEAVAAAFETARASTEALLTDVRDGSIAFPEAVYRDLLIHETLRTAIRTALTPEQLEILAALRPLMRHDPPLPLYL